MAAFSKMPTIQVRVKPGSRVSALAAVADGTYVAQVKAPPVDGKANEELVALVAKHYGCHRSAVTVKAGASSRTKLVHVAVE